ncbi:MAG: hypothetical protein WC028_30785 [Candidatus Obscuribacterales bacterium]
MGEFLVATTLLLSVVAIVAAARQASGSATKEKVHRYTAMDFLEAQAKSENLCNAFSELRT